MEILLVIIVYTVEIGRGGNVVRDLCVVGRSCLRYTIKSRHCRVFEIVDDHKLS